MKLFFLCYSKILQTPSAELAAEVGTEILQTLSAKSESAENRPTALRKPAALPISATLSRISQPEGWLDLLQALSQRFPLPWSHYVKLLTVKAERQLRTHLAGQTKGGTEAWVAQGLGFQKDEACRIRRRIPSLSMKPSF